jgi:hypothetical protein
MNCPTSFPSKSFKMSYSNRTSRKISFSWKKISSRRSSKKIIAKSIL